MKNQLDDRCRLLAIRTFEVAVLDNRDESVERPHRVIDRGLGYVQLERDLHV